MIAEKINLTEPESIDVKPEVLKSFAVDEVALELTGSLSELW